MSHRPPGKPVTRFAPSPTGYLHIGGARTALFNWAYARRHGGTFILRMEDTDVARSTERSARQIIGDLQWLGLNWDEGPDPDAADLYAPATQRGDMGPYFQSQRGELYRQYLDKLHQLGRAYRCFKTAGQLAAERDAAKAAGRPMRYDPTEALHRSDAEQQKLIAEGRPFVWRFRMPESDITVHDLVLGDVTIKREELEDFVIMKSDAAGSGPTFHFANVVDDATMAVTHVLRAQEHLMNTPKHVAMFDALGIARPSYAHMPLIFNPDGTKMSKRDKAKTARAAAQKWIKEKKSGIDGLADLMRQALSAPPWKPEEDKPRLREFLDKKTDDNAIAVPLAEVMGVALPEIDVHDFQQSGYLREVLLNYIALLGWSPGSNIERFDLDFLQREFDIERLGKANAKFDRAKLLAFNAERLAGLPLDEFEAKLRQHMSESHSDFQMFCFNMRPDMFRVFAQAYQQRARTLDEPFVAGQFFRYAPSSYDAKAVEKVIRKNDNAGLTTLKAVREALANVALWEPSAIHAAIEQFAATTNRPLGDVAQPLRIALTGSTVSPPIDQTLAILGKDETLKRIDQCVDVLSEARP